MQYRIEGGSLPALIINLNPGETIISESGGRTWSRGPIVTETKGGSAGKAFGRLLSGESLFMSHYTAQGPAEIAFTSSFPGRIVARELKAGQSVICQKSAFLCATEGVELSAYVQKKAGAGFVGGLIAVAVMAAIVVYLCVKADKGVKAEYALSGKK